VPFYAAPPWRPGYLIAPRTSELRVTCHSRASGSCEVFVADGRARLLAEAQRGIYKLTFDTGAYDPNGFYPETSIVFRVDVEEQHYHVPLLLSPFGYAKPIVVRSYFLAVVMKK
jgi:hypothetical protein